MSQADWIRMAFPSEPEWSSIPDSTLLELVRGYYMEQSCAGLALGQLASRRHPQAEALCRFLLDSQDADVYLRHSALDSLIGLNPLAGFDRAMAFVDDDDVLVDVIVALNYECQGPLADAVRRHPIVGAVRSRIARRLPHVVDFSEYFAANFGLDRPPDHC